MTHNHIANCTSDFCKKRHARRRRVYNFIKQLMQDPKHIDNSLTFRKIVNKLKDAFEFKIYDTLVRRVLDDLIEEGFTHTIPDLQDMRKRYYVCNAPKLEEIA